MIQIPIYRAKRKDNCEYIQGYFNYGIGTEFGTIIKIPQIGVVGIDPSTLAIHFPDMLDKNNNPIFASLSEDFLGSTFCSIDQLKLMFYFDGFRFWLGDSTFRELCKEGAWNCFKITGIHEGEDQ